MIQRQLVIVIEKRKRVEKQWKLKEKLRLQKRKKNNNKKQSKKRGSKKKKKNGKQRESK